MKKNLLNLLCLIVFATFNSFAQLQVDKQLQMTGTSNADRQIIGVGNPSDSSHAVNAGNIQKGELVYASASGSGSAYSVSLSPAVIAYTAGMIVNFKANVANNNPVTLSVNGLTATPIKKQVTNDLSANDILANQLVSVIFDGTNFQLLSNASGSTGWGLTGNSATIDGTNFIGTTDNVPFNLKVNNQKAGKIENTMQNTFLGYQSGNANTSGAQNTAVGFGSLLSNTSGIGNTVLGLSALATNIGGNWNTAVGIQALYFNTADNNTALGTNALNSNTSGSANTAAGLGALYSNTTANYNTAFGHSALHNTTTGNVNTAVGYIALASNVTGAENTAVGQGALINSNSNGNTAIGYAALNSNTTGTFNTACGHFAFLNGAGFSNSTALGFNAPVSANNYVAIGNTSVTSIKGQVGFTTYSDGRVKNDVHENVPGLSFIRLLRPVTYHYDVDKENEIIGSNNELEWNGKYDVEKILFSGFIAQEVDVAAKKVSYSFSGIDKSGSLWGLRYAEFTVPLVKAVQEQQKIIEAQEKTIGELKRENNSLRADVDIIKSWLRIDKGNRQKLSEARETD